MFCICTLYFVLFETPSPPLDEFGDIDVGITRFFFTLRAPNKGGNFHLMVLLTLMVAN